MFAPDGADASEIKMFTRGNAFDTQDTYLVTSGHGGYNCSPGTPEADRKCALDIHALRWDGPSAAWTRSRTQPGITSPSPFSDDVMWEMPIYAPADGEIIACWRRMPDDDVDGDKVNCPGGAGECSPGGNHLNIVTADGELLFFGHLRQDSIPAELCPIDDVYLYPSDPKTCALGGTWGGLRESSRLDLLGVPSIPVKKGQLLGRVGTSGQGVGVHLHTHIQPYAHDGANPCAGPSLPLEFAESWYQERTPGVFPSAEDWIPLERHVLPIDGGDFLLWPDPMGPRQDEIHIEPGTMPALAATNSGGVVAYRNNDGHLAVVAFEYEADGDFALGNVEEEGDASDIALAAIDTGAPHAVAVVRNGANKLQAVPYYVTGAADVVRGNDYVSAGTIWQVEATRSPSHDGVAVAFMNSTLGLSVTDFTVTETGAKELTPKREGTATSASAVANFDIATVVAGREIGQSSGAFKGVVTAEQRSSDGMMIVRSWSITAAGVVTLVDSEFARDVATNNTFSVTDVDVSVVGSATREFAVISARLSANGALRVQAWEIANNGQLTRLEQSDAGAIGLLASAKVGTQDVLTSVAGSFGDLLGISWSVSPNAVGMPGGALRRVGTRVAGEISAVAVDGWVAGDDLVAAVRDSTNRITLIHYLTNYDSGL